MPGPGVLGLLVCALGACTYFDPGQPISLELEGGWAGSQREAVVQAAECWNLGFGTRITVGGTARQRVVISFSELLCMYGLGRAETTQPVRIHVCSHRDRQFASLDSQIFHATVHELGHVLNIIRHGSSNSVMAQAVTPSTFTAEDQALFAEANPDFRPVPVCPVSFGLQPPACRCAGAP